MDRPRMSTPRSTSMRTTQQKHNERGSAMVELALSVVVLVMIMTGVIEFGRMFYFASEVANAARAGVQYAVVNPSSASSLTTLQTAATNDAIDMTNLTATATRTCECDSGSAVDCTTGTCVSGSVRTYVKVVATAPFRTIGNYHWIPRPISMSAQATIRVK